MAARFVAVGRHVQGGRDSQCYQLQRSISACEKGEQWQHALLLLEDICRAGVTLYVISFSAAISACEKGGQWQHALSLLEPSCYVCM